MIGALDAAWKGIRRMGNWAILGLGLCLVLVSYALNLGWFRVILAVVAIPYFALYTVLNLLFLAKVPDGRLKQALFGTGLLTCVGWNLTWIDVGDAPPMRCCFGLFRYFPDSTGPSNLDPDVVMPIFWGLLAVHAAAVAFQAAMLAAGWIAARRERLARIQADLPPLEER